MLANLAEDGPVRGVVPRVVVPPRLRVPLGKYDSEAMLWLPVDEADEVSSTEPTVEALLGRWASDGRGGVGGSG